MVSPTFLPAAGNAGTPNTLPAAEIIQLNNVFTAARIGTQDGNTISKEQLQTVIDNKNLPTLTKNNAQHILDLLNITKSPNISYGDLKAMINQTSSKGELHLDVPNTNTTDSTSAL
jgi:hypothetical protein